MKSTLKALHESVPDVLMVAGIGALTYGASLIYVPAGWIVAGGFAFAFGLMIARRSGNS
jgi:hypothetical protein